MLNGNTTETYNYNDDKNSSNSRYLKLISLSINNKLSHFEQLTKSVIMIESVFDNAKIGDILKY